LSIADPTLADLRRSYETEGLREADAPEAPMVLLRQWLDEAIAAGCLEPTGMALSTVTAEGRPRARMVLCKGVSEEGIRFFTNHESAKAMELEASGFAAVAFWWDKLARQIRVEGSVERLPRAESEAYFAVRPRESQLGAWASPQSQVVASREALDALQAEVEERFAGGPVPCPPHWGGYLIRPDRVEAWMGGVGRLHDRLVWEREGATWRLTRLAP
jgi:pyridoxamine 5'-phosphate oxidase